MAAIPNYHKHGGLKQQGYTTAEVCSQYGGDAGRACEASRGSRGGSRPHLFQLPVTAHIPWLVTPSLQAPPPWSPCPLFCQLYFCLCLRLLKTSAIGFRTYPDNPRQSLHPKILNHICKVFGTEVTSPGSRNQDADTSLEGHYLAYHYPKDGAVGYASRQVGATSITHHCICSFRLSLTTILPNHPTLGLSSSRERQHMGFLPVLLSGKPQVIPASPGEHCP